MQSFTDSALVFEGFVQNYSGYAALLHDTTHNSFSWNINTWKVCYVKDLECLKEAIQATMVLHYLDHELEWIIRTNISQVACAVVLFIIVINEDNKKAYKLIGCASKSSLPKKRARTYTKRCICYILSWFTFTYYL